MIVYEITAEVNDELIEPLERYMLEIHIPDVVAAGAFVSAQMVRFDNIYRITYLIADRPSLDEYMSGPAVKLRSDFAETFPVDVAVTRRIGVLISGPASSGQGSDSV